MYHIVNFTYLIYIYIYIYTYIYIYYVAVSKCCRNHFISEKYKYYNHLSYTAFKVVTFFKYKLLTATVKILETFLESVLLKDFQLFRRILKYVSSNAKVPSIQSQF